MISLSDAQDQLNLSHVTLAKWLARLGIVPKRTGKSKFITEADLETIRSMKGGRTQKYETESFSERYFTDQTAELIFLRQQLQEKGRQLSDVHALLSREQELSLIREQRIEQLTGQLKQLQTSHERQETASVPLEVIAVWEKTRDAILATQETLKQFNKSNLRV